MTSLTFKECNFRLSRFILKLAFCVGHVGFAIEGPSQARIECEDQNDGSCDVRYWPTEPGEYAVHILCDDEDIEESPFMAYIIPDNKGSKPDQVQTSQTHAVLYIIFLMSSTVDDSKIELCQFQAFKL